MFSFRVSGVGLIPAADWLRVRILLSGGPLLHHPGDVSSHRMTLDMRRGALLQRPMAPAQPAYQHQLGQADRRRQPEERADVHLQQEEGVIARTIAKATPASTIRPGSIQTTPVSVLPFSRTRDVAPISLSVAGKIYEFISGTTRVFQLEPWHKRALFQDGARRLN